MAVKEKKLSQICLSAEVTILDAIERMNETRKGIILICFDDKKLLGTVTDADVRTGLASGISLDEKITKITNTNPKTLPFGSKNSEIIECFKKTKFRAIPLVDLDNFIVDCLFVDQFSDSKAEQRILMIMAGGFGKRMGSLTEDTPKPMLRVKGKPILEHIVERAVIEKFENIFVSTHYLAGHINDYFGDGRNFGVKMDYINEVKPLDTAGSFAKLPVESGPVVVTNADVITNVAYTKLIEFHQLHDASITVAIHHHIIKHPFGVIISDGIDFLGIEEKPNWTTNINAGIYVLDASLKHLIEDGEALGMPELIKRVKQANKRVIVFPLHEDWVDLGSKADYLKHKD